MIGDARASGACTGEKTGMKLRRMQGSMPVIDGAPMIDVRLNLGMLFGFGHHVRVQPDFAAQDIDFAAHAVIVARPPGGAEPAALGVLAGDLLALDQGRCEFEGRGAFLKKGGGAGAAHLPGQGGKTQAMTAADHAPVAGTGAKAGRTGIEDKDVAPRPGQGQRCR